MKNWTLLLVLLAAGCSGSASVESGADYELFDATETVLAQAPVGLVASPGDRAVHLSWKAPPGTEATAYHVYWRSELPGPPWANEADPLPVSGAPDVEVGDLDNGSIYYFAVSAETASGESMLSFPVHAVPRRAVGELVHIPSGVFQMGRDGVGDASPVHDAFINAFFIDRYTATNEEYRACVDANGCDPPAKDSGLLYDLVEVPDYFTNPLYDEFPVVYLEHHHAETYCAWRGMRLPTEAEWEKAARGTLMAGTAYPWGESTPDCSLANYAADGVFCAGGPMPVDAYPDNASPYGVMGMVGNVWEWTSDWYDPNYYDHSACRNPPGPETGFEKVLRGGAWYYDADALAVSYRNHWTPTFAFEDKPIADYRGFGVRCALSDPDTPCDPAIAQCLMPQGAICVSKPPDKVPEPNPSEGSDPGEGPCVPPQSNETSPSECFANTIGCPSGWPLGCESKMCSCAIGISAAPGECGHETAGISLNWRDGEGGVHPLTSRQSIPVCEGVQSGTHLALVVELDLPDTDDEAVYRDTYIETSIDGILVGGLNGIALDYNRLESGLYRTGKVKVKFEGCSAEAYAGRTLTIRALVRLENLDWGFVERQVELLPVDQPAADYEC